MDSALWVRQKTKHKHTQANVMNALLVQSSFALDRGSSELNDKP